MHVSLDKLSTLPFVAPKSSLFLNCCSYYLVISIKTFLLTMHQIHRGPSSHLLPVESQYRRRKEEQELGKRKLRTTTPPYPKPSTRRRRTPALSEHLHRADAVIVYTSADTRRPRLSTAPPLSSIKPTIRSRPDSHPSPFAHLVCWSPTLMLSRNLHPA